MSSTSWKVVTDVSPSWMQPAISGTVVRSSSWRSARACRAVGRRWHRLGRPSALLALTWLGLVAGSHPPSSRVRRHPAASRHYFVRCAPSPNGARGPRHHRGARVVHPALQREVTWLKTARVNGQGRTLIDASARSCSWLSRSSRCWSTSSPRSCPRRATPLLRFTEPVPRRCSSTSSQQHACQMIGAGAGRSLSYRAPSVHWWGEPGHSDAALNAFLNPPRGRTTRPAVGCPPVLYVPAGRSSHASPDTWANARFNDTITSQLMLDRSLCLITAVMTSRPFRAAHLAARRHGLPHPCRAPLIHAATPWCRRGGPVARLYGRLLTAVHRHLHITPWRPLAPHLVFLRLARLRARSTSRMCLPIHVSQPRLLVNALASVLEREPSSLFTPRISDGFVSSGLAPSRTSRRPST